MIVVTGGEGFIGKNLVRELQRRGNLGVVVLDIKNEPIESINAWLNDNAEDIDVIFHLGAITDTKEMDFEIFYKYNLTHTIFIWNLCATFQIPLIYASSAATYGNGELGFDDEKSLFNLQPLNPYGWSKQDFDKWNSATTIRPPYWYGLKFFNVYGYSEDHKGSMASTIYHFYLQSQTNRQCEVDLFKSHNPKYLNGEQLRDFIYVDDVVDVCLFLYNEKPVSGIYNVGTGKACTFNDVAKAVFKSIKCSGKINYIDTPIELRDKYQYFTEAKIDKLRNAGYKKEFTELESGVEKYVNMLRHENR